MSQAVLEVVKARKAAQEVLNAMSELMDDTEQDELLALLALVILREMKE